MPLGVIWPLSKWKLSYFFGCSYIAAMAFNSIYHIKTAWVNGNTIYNTYSFCGFSPTRRIFWLFSFITGFVTIYILFIAKKPPPNNQLFRSSNLGEPLEKSVYVIHPKQNIISNACVGAHFVRCLWKFKKQITCLE